MSYRRVILWLVAIYFSNICLAADEPLDINSASAQQIEAQLPGIGKVKAQAIISYRKRNGPFTSVKQLLEVKGVGPQTLERIEPLINVGDGQVQAHSALVQNNLEQYDKAVKQAIRQIVTRAKTTGTSPE